ncbi:uncharacterized protein FIBRA_02511 [Fibroporia radiculosa]|uniref:DUF6534 domain-containing protein n=1 Tax=Fibroporia radiculosa TaxID=599839 RepID=J4HV22_9APHY|nr:uncharacterized protein FIBRA_02511 [Fibroporia radiculosa]CCM00477.1 predicted protein [Fibroporia radiculosa]
MPRYRSISYGPHSPFGTNHLRDIHLRRYRLRKSAIADDPYMEPEGECRTHFHPAHTVVTGLLDVIVRSLFCHRMWNLSQKNRLLTFTIESCALVAFAGSLLFSIKCFTVIGDVFRLSQLSWIMYGSLGAGVVTDILIALSLCIVLRRCRNKNPDTDSLVRMLITYGINSGALTSLCEIACLVSYATMQNNLVFIAIFFILPKLLLNSLLATLNARPELRKKYASTTASRQSVKPSLPPSPSFRFSHRTFQGSIYTKEVMDIDFRKQCAAGIILPPATPKLGRVVSYQISRAELDRTVPLND